MNPASPSVPSPDAALPSATPRRSAPGWCLVGLAGLGLGALLLVLGAGRGGAQEASSPSVKIVDFTFDALETTVESGTTVTWRNTGGRPHTVTDRGGTFDTGPISPNDSGTVTFSTPGTYFYFCRINPQRMNGVVVVEPGAAPSPSVRVQAVDPGNIEGESFRFDPAELTVPAGTNLVVANVGGKPHTLTADDATFTTPQIQPGAEEGRFAGTSVTLTLNRTGTFPFHCEVHPQAMKGTITVTAAATAATAAPTTEAPTTTVAPTTAPPAPGGAPPTVDIADFQFVQKEVTVAPGGEVVFRNQGQAPHTATFDDVDGIDTGTIESGAEGRFTVPEQPGTYSFHCNFHPSMRSVVLVEAAPAPPTPTSETPTSETPTSETPTSADTTSAAVDTTAVSPATEVPATEATTEGPALAATVPSDDDDGGVSALAIATAAVAVVLGGAGLAAFARRRRYDEEE